MSERTKKVLIVGGGGREHALAWALARSPQVAKIYCAPGNAGIGEIAECVPISADDVPTLARFARDKGVDLTVVGPEIALVRGIVDAFAHLGLKIVGPSARAAILEGSKEFSKNLMRKYGIPTGFYSVFKDAQGARRYAHEIGAPLVVKADGLAAGKGVFVCRTIEEADEAIDSLLTHHTFGDAGAKIVVEEFIEGEEASFMVFTDGEEVLRLPTAQDHKAIYDGDSGPNTGGMGAYSPAPVIDERLRTEVMNRIMIPTVEAMAAEGRPFRGVLYAGLMITGNGPKVLEFNVRFGDPEAQPILARLRGDLYPLLEAVAAGKLYTVDLAWDPRPAVCVVMSARGYPGAYDKGHRITGLEAARALDDVTVFHAGTAYADPANPGAGYVTAGGRVLGVTAVGADIPGAIARAYEAVERIRWDGAYYRKDIGQKAVKRLKERA